MSKCALYQIVTAHWSHDNQALRQFYIVLHLKLCKPRACQPPTRKRLYKVYYGFQTLLVVLDNKPLGASYLQVNKSTLCYALREFARKRLLVDEGSLGVRRVYKPSLFRFLPAYIQIYSSMLFGCGLIWNVSLKVNRLDSEEALIKDWPFKGGYRKNSVLIAGRELLWMLAIERCR